MRISEQRWQEAQAAERRFHDQDMKHYGLEGMKAKYKDSYRQYFEWLGMDFDLKGKSIIEIGPADIPALYFCENGLKCVIIEPMPSDTLLQLVTETNEKNGFAYPHLFIANQTAESFDLESMQLGFDHKQWDEVWMFNLLQHVVDPDALIEKAKTWAKVIRFFEPVDQLVSDCHPHAPTQADFKRWFGDAAKLYEGNPHAVNFHTANCMYGTWTKE